MFEKVYVALKRNMNVKGDFVEDSEGNKENDRESFCCLKEHINCHEQDVGGNMKLRVITRKDCVSCCWRLEGR